MSSSARQATSCVLKIVIIGGVLAQPEVSFFQSPLSIKYVNGLDESISIWFQPEGSPSFLRPPVSLNPHSEQSASLSGQDPGKRYIVIRDEANRDTRVGWVDLEAIAKSNSPVMLIDGVTVTETVMQTHTVFETRTRTVIGPDGKRRTITTQVPVQRTEPKTIRRQAVQLKCRVNNEWKLVPTSDS
jgi:hypothetical protein